MLIAGLSEKSNPITPLIMRTLNRLFIMCLICLFGHLSLQAQDEWITDPNTVTYRLSGRILVKSNLVIRENQQVIIEPGTTIFLGPFGGIDIHGQITALGSPEQPIEFVRHEDGIRWGAVVLRSSEASNQFSHCLFSGGGDSHNNRYATIALYGASAEFSQCTFTGSSGPGIYIENCDPEITLCDFIDNQGPAIEMTTNADPLHHLNTAKGNGINAISLRGGEVDRDITFDEDGLPYHLNSSLSLTGNAKLTVSPGCRLELGTFGSILASAGSIQAIGTPEQPIEFVRHEDGLTWGAVVLGSSEASSQFSHCLFSGGGGSINYNYAMLFIDGGTVLVNGCIFKDSNGSGVRVQNSVGEVGVTITNSLFTGNEYGVYSNASSGPLMAIYYSAFSGNKQYGIYNPTKHVVDASMGNYWDDPSGPLDTLDTDGLGLINQTNADQEGRQKVSEYVMWNNPAATPPTGWTDDEPDPDHWINNLSPFGQQAFGLGCAVLNEANPFSVRIPIIRDVEIFDLEAGSSDMTLRNHPVGSYQEGDTLLIELLLEPRETGNYFSLISINTGLDALPQLIQIRAQAVLSAEECVLTPVRITFDPADEITPSWHPSKNQIIYASNRPPSNSPDVWNIGLVEAEGHDERLIITGANSRYGVAHHPTWSGTGEEILTEERVGLHEYIEIKWKESDQAVDVSQTDFRSLAIINGGGGGSMFALSRDKSTFLWRFGSRYGQENISIRSAPFSEMNGRMADAFGFVHIALQARSPDFIHQMGGSINSDGTWFVLPEPSGEGVDLFMRKIDGSAEPIRLTSSGLQNGAINRSPEISPDDSSIAFIHESGGNKQVDLAFYDIAREIEVILTNDALREADPSWSPDGNQLVFSRYDTAESSGLRFGEIPNHNLYTINLSVAVDPDPDPDPDPDQNGSAPLTIHRAIELEFEVEETRNYILQYSHDLTNWQDYQFISNQSPGPMSIFVRQSKETQFWRLLYQAP